MSGIAGIIHFDGAPIEPGLIERMTGAMAYRGPDGINHWVRGSVALGQCMLHTTPESLEEHQPLTNEDESLVLVMDGRVDNWEELRRDLLSRGARLRTRADAELVIRAYETWGRDCLGQIDGDFALVIWDARHRQAFCARDRMGHKPFNYHWDGKTLAFASELHTLLALPWVPEELHQGMFAEFLAAEWYSKDETFWRGILRLVQSHQMEVSRQGLRLRQYWQPDFAQTLPIQSDAEYIEYYRELFSDMVRRMSRSHQPVAYEVSGGLDSSAVFCLAEQLLRLGKLPAPGLAGYTLAFPNDKNANELEYSRAVGEHLGVEICEVPPSAVPLSWYRDWASHYREFPGYPNGAMSLGLREKARGRGSRVLLGGCGGDEWFGTDRGIYYTEELMSSRWRNLWRCFSADCREAGISRGLWWFLRFGMVPLLPPAFQDFLRSGRRKMALGGANFRVDNAAWLTDVLRSTLDERREAKSNIPAVCFNRLGQRRQRQLLSDAYIPLACELEERMAARLGLELRQPMQTSRLVEFAIATPERLRIRGQRNKFMHRRAMQDVLPKQVLNRTSKADFSILFREHLARMEVDLLRDIPKRRCSWVEQERMQAVFEYYRDRLATGRSSSGGKAQWILWNLFGCDLLLEKSPSIFHF